VVLADGRQVEGQLDDATDSEHLWLRRGDDRALLAVCYRWQEVARVEVAGRRLDRHQLLAEPERHVVPWPDDFFSAADHRDDPSANRPTIAPRRRAPQSITFVAALANWDSDVEPDGYEAAVTLLDHHGQPTAARGMLTARLVGSRLDRQGRITTPSVELERWSQRMDARQLANGSAVVRLPFRRVRPERQLDLAPRAFFEVEFAAPGHGSFAASTTVPLREYDPVRDRLQQATGSRFFTGERSGR